MAPENELAVDGLDGVLDNSLVSTFDFVCAKPLKVVAKAGKVEKKASMSETMSLAMQWASSSSTYCHRLHLP